VKSSHI